MQAPPEALATHEASITIRATADDLYAMVADISRMGEWSPEATGGRWLDGATGQVGDWFEGDNQTPEREWSRQCQVAVADPGAEFTFVVGGIEANCTWWSYEFAPAADGATQVTERWWLVNKTPAIAAATPEQFTARVAMTKDMLHTTLENLRAAAEQAS